MGSRNRKKWVYELAKASLIVGLFALIQNQIASVRHDLSGGSSNVAHALVRYQDDLAQAREALLKALESSRTQLAVAREDLEETAQRLSSGKEAISRLLSDRDEELVESFSVKMANYQESLSAAILRSEKNDVRIRTIENEVRRFSSNNPNWMETAMLYPILQLKGNKTVGSGVVIYSEPKTPDDPDSLDRAYTTFAVTAYHVVKEIIGSEFPVGTLNNVRVFSDTGTLHLTSATVETYSAERDLALLRLRSDSRFRHVARFLPQHRVSDLKLFTRVYAVGCPLGNKPLPTYGEISSKTKAVGDQNFWMVTAPTFFGNSGGGIFLSGSCELIGISSMIYTYTYGLNRSMVVPHMGLFVPIDAVIEWLKSEGYEFVYAGAPEPVAVELELDAAAGDQMPPPDDS